MVHSDFKYIKLPRTLEPWNPNKYKAIEVHRNCLWSLPDGKEESTTNHTLGIWASPRLTTAQAQHTIDSHFEGRQRPAAEPQKPGRQMTCFRRSLIQEEASSICMKCGHISSPRVKSPPPQGRIEQEKPNLERMRRQIHTWRLLNTLSVFTNCF